MEITFPSGMGPAELRRDDGWFYRLHGVVGIDMKFDCYTWDAPGAILVITIANVKDETLESIKVLRDAFPDSRVEIETD